MKSGENVLLIKCFNFALRSVELYKILGIRDNTYSPIYRQFLISSTSIGANSNEAQSASSRKDFINKLNIALKERRESEYWIRLLKDAEILTLMEYESIINDCRELIKLLTSIIKSSKRELLKVDL